MGRTVSTISVAARWQFLAVCMTRARTGKRRISVEIAPLRAAVDVRNERVGDALARLAAAGQITRRG
jgi:hypothetical protein